MKKEFLAVFHLISIARTVQELNFRFEKKFELSLAQWMLLSHLKDLPGCSAFDLSEALQVHPSSLTPALKRLKKKGFIAISNDPKDSRRKNLYLTREGRDQIQSLTPHIRPLVGNLQLTTIQKIDQTLTGRNQI